VQGRVVPAQYYRDPEDLEPYLEHSAFLADINGERSEARNGSYARRLSSLERLVMIMFEDDTTVIPKESAWFAEFNRTSGERTLLEERDIYKEDWIGLKALGDGGKLEFLTVPGAHMQLGHEVLRELFEKYLGGKVEMETETPKERVRIDDSEL
jgi:palmitoyl-protein thioesterase